MKCLWAEMGRKKITEMHILFNAVKNMTEN